MKKIIAVGVIAVNPDKVTKSKSLPQSSGLFLISNHFEFIQKVVSLSYAHPS